MASAIAAPVEVMAQEHVQVSKLAAGGRMASGKGVSVTGMEAKSDEAGSCGGAGEVGSTRCTDGCEGDDSGSSLSQGQYRRSRHRLAAARTSSELGHIKAELAGVKDRLLKIEGVMDEAIGTDISTMVQTKLYAMLRIAASSLVPPPGLSASGMDEYGLHDKSKTGNDGAQMYMFDDDDAETVILGEEEPDAEVSPAKLLLNTALATSATAPLCLTGAKPLVGEPEAVEGSVSPTKDVGTRSSANLLAPDRRKASSLPAAPGCDAGPGQDQMAPAHLQEQLAMLVVKAKAMAKALPAQAAGAEAHTSKSVDEDTAQPTIKEKFDRAADNEAMAKATASRETAHEPSKEDIKTQKSDGACMEYINAHKSPRKSDRAANKKTVAKAAALREGDVTLAPDSLRITFCSVFSDRCTTEVVISRQLQSRKIAARLGAGIAKVIIADDDGESFEACNLLHLEGDFIMSIDDILACQQSCMEITVSSVLASSDSATCGELIMQTQRHIQKRLYGCG